MIRNPKATGNHTMVDFTIRHLDYSPLTAEFQG